MMEQQDNNIVDLEKEKAKTEYLNGEIDHMSLISINKDNFQRNTSVEVTKKLDLKKNKQTKKQG
jgi:hypothetical protein